MTLRIPRRTFLRGAGAAVALPWLEAMGLLPSASERSVAFADAPGRGVPLRLLFLYVPNGVDRSSWTPRTEGAAFALPPTLEPLKPVRESVLVLSGLTQAKANANGDGPGDHARAAASFLTSAQAFKTKGAPLRVGVSVDQVAAAEVGRETMFPSLEVGCDPGATSGDCDSGYSCAYSSHVSWRSASMPMAKEVDPAAVYDRLFTDPGGPGTGEERARRAGRRRRVLDLVREDAAHLSARLGTSDRGKVDEYLTGLREVEVRLDRAAKASGDGKQAGDGGRPSGVPKDFGEHVKLLSDLLVLAFQGDVTRVATFLLANEGSNRSYPMVEVPEGHHGLSHHGDDAGALAKIARVDRWHVQRLADLLARMKAVREGDGTLLDHVLVTYGSGIGDGNRHDHADLPVLLCGGGGGTVASGRHVKAASGTPLANLYVSLLERMGVRTSSFGDSTGPLVGLT